MDQLTLTAQQRGGWLILALRGQLDVATAPALRQRLQAEQQPGGVCLVLDFEGLQFLDSFGIGVLAGGVKRARASGGRLVVARPSERIRGVLELAGIAQALEPADTLEEVVATTSAAGGTGHLAQ